MGKKTEPITKFQKQCRAYFSSLSARGCKYLYLNLPNYEDCLILSNADPDMLITYTSLPMVSVHIIRPKDGFLTTFKQLFSLDQIESQCYIIRTEFITQVFKDNRIESVFAQIDPMTKNLFVLSGGKEITIQFNDEDLVGADEEDFTVEESTNSTLSELEAILVDDGWDSGLIKRSMLSLSNVAGAPLSDPFIIDELCTIISGMITENSKLEKQELKSLISQQDFFKDKNKYSSNWYLSEVFNGAHFKPDNQVVYRQQRLLLVDGLDMPSIKEFLCKQVVKNQFVGMFNLYIYNATGDTVRCLACYDAPDVAIISTRPYMETVLVQEKTNPREKSEEVSHVR